MKHIVTNHRELPGAIGRTSDGDTIICGSADLAELGERARKRMYPSKRLSFVVVAPFAGINGFLDFLDEVDTPRATE